MQYLIQVYGDIICPENWKAEGVNKYYRFYFIKGGEATYISSNKTMNLNSNSLYIFPANEQYTIIHNPKSPLNVLWFHVVIFSPLKINVTEIDTKNNHFLYHLLKSLTYATKTTKSDVEKLFSVLFDNVLSIININAIDRNEIVFILNYLEQNPFEKLSNKQLAALIGYSEKYFIRLFTRYIGIQPHKYILRVRLSYAVKLLIEGKSVKEVASLVGYGNVNNFSRDFKLNYMLSPIEYLHNYAKMP